MLHEFYVPIYKQPESEDGAGCQFGTCFYIKLEDLYMMEPDAVDYFIVTGETPEPSKRSKAV